MFHFFSQLSLIKREPSTINKTNIIVEHREKKKHQKNSEKRMKTQFFFLQIEYSQKRIKSNLLLFLAVDDF